MRLSVLAVSALGLVFSWGCKPPPKAETEAKFKAEVRRYFNNLNADNEQRREALTREMRRHEESPVFQPPAGMVYQTFVFEPEAFVVTNYKCRACGVRLMMLIPALEYLCPSCHHGPYQDHQPGTDLRKWPCSLCARPEPKQKTPEEEAEFRKKFEALKDEGVAVKGMFEVTQGDPGQPMEATVRYIRREWAWDRRGVVAVGAKGMEKAREKGIDDKWIPVTDGGTEPTQRPGFYRLDTQWLGEYKFRLKGDILVKMEGPREEPLRPWKDLQTIK